MKIEEIRDVLSLLSTIPKDNIKFGENFEKKINERTDKQELKKHKIDKPKVKKFIYEKQLLGILDQGGGAYRLFYKLNSNLDLVLPIRINQNVLTIITAYPNNSEYRKRT